MISNKLNTFVFVSARRGQNICCRGDSGELYVYQPSALINNSHQLQAMASDYSGPPSYRSRTSTLRPGGCHQLQMMMIDPAAAAMVMASAATTVGSHHSRDPSQLSSAMSEAVGGGGGSVVMPTVDDKLSVDVDMDVDVNVDADEKTAADRMIGRGPVTIVQTTPATNPPGTVIVTVSSANNDAITTNVRCGRETEMDILAHL